MRGAVGSRQAAMPSLTKSRSSVSLISASALSATGKILKREIKAPIAAELTSR